MKTHNKSFQRTELTGIPQSTISAIKKFTSIDGNRRVEYAPDDDRKVRITFSETEQGIRVVETLDAEDEHSTEQQRQGWQSLLNNFRKHVEISVLSDSNRSCFGE